MSNFLAPNGRSTVIVPAAESIAVFTQGQAQVSRTLGFPNYPDVTTLIGTVTNGQTVLVHMRLARRLLLSLFLPFLCFGKLELRLS
jgi:hypothetical protein